MLYQMEANPNAAIAGPRLRLPDGRLAGCGCTTSFTHPRGWQEPDQGQYRHTEAVLSVGGSCFLVRCEFLDEVGGWDEQFPLYYEETDLCCQATVRGCVVLYVGEAEVTHHHGASTSSNPEIARQVAQWCGESRVKFLEKWREYPEFVRLAGEK